MDFDEEVTKSSPVFMTVGEGCTLDEIENNFHNESQISQDSQTLSETISNKNSHDQNEENHQILTSRDSRKESEGISNAKSCDQNEGNQHTNTIVPWSGDAGSGNDKAHQIIVHDSLELEVDKDNQQIAQESDCSTTIVNQHESENVCETKDSSSYIEIVKGNAYFHSTNTEQYTSSIRNQGSVSQCEPRKSTEDHTCSTEDEGTVSNCDPRKVITNQINSDAPQEDSISSSQHNEPDSNQHDVNTDLGGDTVNNKFSEADKYHYTVNTSQNCSGSVTDVECDESVRNKQSSVNHENHNGVADDGNDRNKQESNINHGSPDGVADDGNEESANDQHTVKLGKVCRICGEMTVKHEGPKKGIQKQEIVKHVKKIWNVDISDERPDIYPVNVCISCERKIKRVYLKVSKRKKCELFREKPAEFVEHIGGDCAVCMLEEKPETPPPCIPQCQLNRCDHEENSVSICLPPPEPRRNSARKRCFEGREASQKTVSSQTDESIGHDNTTGLEEHDYIEGESKKQFLVMPKKHGGRMPYHKQSLSAVNAKYIRQDRLKPLIAHIDKFCEIHKEDKTEVLFFLLVQTLRDIGDRSRESVVEDIWCKRGSAGNTLTQEECLAKRILLKQTKDQYRKEYSYYKEKLDVCVLKPPFMLDRLEKTYFPENLEYHVTESQGGSVTHRHPKTSGPSYLAVTQTEGGGRGEGQGWRVLGVRWHYIDALAKTLEELWGTLGLEEGENIYLQADVSDYWEERRDTTSCAEKSDQTGRTSPSKMVTYMFRVQSLLLISHDKASSVYKADSNVNMYRPLMKAIVGEGGTLQPALSAIEKERTDLMNKVLHISVSPTSTLKIIVGFTSSVAEMRKDYRNLSGLNLWSLRRGPAVVNRYGSMCLELKRGWLATSPRLVSVSTIISTRTKCSRCGHQGHNVRRCPVKGEDGESKRQHWKRMRKHRSVPTSLHPPLSSLPTQVVSHDVKLGGCVRPATSEPVMQLPPSCAAPAATAGQDTSTVVTAAEMLWSSRTITSTDSFSGLPSAAPCSNLTSSTSCQASTLPIQPPQVVAGPNINQGGSQNTSAPVYVWTYTVVQPPPHTQHQNLVSHQSLTSTAEPDQTNQASVTQPHPPSHLPPIKPRPPANPPLSHMTSTTQPLKTEHQANPAVPHMTSTTQPLKAEHQANPSLPHMTSSAQPHLFPPSSQQQSAPSTQAHPPSHQLTVIHEPPSHHHITPPLPEPPDALTFSQQSSTPHQLSVIQQQPVCQQQVGQWLPSHLTVMPQQPLTVTHHTSTSQSQPPLSEHHSSSQSVPAGHHPSSQSVTLGHHSHSQSQHSTIVIQKFQSQPQQPVIILQHPPTSQPQQPVGVVQQLPSQHQTTVLQQQQPPASQPL